MSARVSSDMRRSFSIGLLLLLPLITWSQSEKRFIKSANKLFEAGAYAESAAIYLILLQQHYQDDPTATWLFVWNKWAIIKPQSTGTRNT